MLKTSDLGTTINSLEPGGTAGDIVRLAVAPAPDDRLFALFPSAGVFVWATDIQSNPPAPAAAQTVAVGNTPLDLAIGEEAPFAYVANSGDSTVSAIALSDLSVTSVNAGLAGTAPAAIAVANTTNGDTVAVLDTTNQTLCLIAIPPTGPASATAIGTPVKNFSYPPLDLQVSLGGRWIYVLEKTAPVRTTVTFRSSMNMRLNSDNQTFSAPHRQWEFSLENSFFRTMDRNYTCLISATAISCPDLLRS